MNSAPNKRYKQRNDKGRFLIFGAPLIKKAEITEVVATMKSGWLGTGPKVTQFERDFCAYKEAWGYPCAVNSCTAALHLSLIASGMKPGDEVITSAMTFCATVNAIIHAGLTPVLADIDGRTMNIDPDDVENRITSKTRAILPVHFAGRACEMAKLCGIAKKHDLILIEDCAHAIETTYHGRPSGTFGEFGCFSFYVTKNVATGEGGMILAKSEQQAARCRTLALHGMSRDAWKRFGDAGYRHYDVIECGFKYNMMDLQAAIGIHQLRRVEDSWKRRREIWGYYCEELKKSAIGLPAETEPDTRHAYHLFTILLDPKLCGISRDRFINKMTANNVGTGVHYRSIPEHRYYKERYGFRPEQFPRATLVGRQTVSLPLTAGLSDADVERVVDSVRDALC